MKREKRTIFNILILCIVLLAPAISAFASEDIITGIKSAGRIIYDNDTPDTSDDVIFDASDLTYLAGQIEVLKDLAQ